MRLDYRIKDLRGQTFGILKVLEFSHTRNKCAYWHCECECGTLKIVRGHSMTHGSTRSCGCLRRNSEIKRAVRLLLPAETRKKIAAMGAKRY